MNAAVLRIADGFRCARITDAKTTAHFRKKWAVDFCCLSEANLFNSMDEVAIFVSAEPGIIEKTA